MTNALYWLDVRALSGSYVDILLQHATGFNTDSLNTPFNYLAADPLAKAPGFVPFVLTGLPAGSYTFTFEEAMDDDTYWLDIRSTDGQYIDVTAQTANDFSIDIPANGLILAGLAVHPSFTRPGLQAIATTANIASTVIPFSAELQEKYWFDVRSTTGQYIEIISNDENGITVQAPADNTPILVLAVDKSFESIYVKVGIEISTPTGYVLFDEAEDVARMQERFLRYLAAWVERTTEEFVAIKVAICDQLTLLNKKVQQLPDTAHTFPGLRIEADEYHILRSGRESAQTLQTLLADRYTLHKRRGTNNQIVTDVRRISGDNTATVSISGELDSGWWMDRTWPDVGDFTYVDPLEICVIEMDNNTSIHSTKELQELLVREVIPNQFSTIFL